MSERLWGKPYLTPAEVGELLGISLRTVRRHLKAGTIPAIRIGRVLRVARADLDRALREGALARPLPRPGRGRRPRVKAAE